MKVFFNALVIHLLFNVYVFVRGWQILPNKKKYKIPYSLLFVVELIIYLIGFIFWEKLPLNILHPITLIGTSWMVFIGYLSVLLLLYDVARLLNKKIKNKTYSKIQTPRVKRFYFLFSFLLVVSTMCCGSYKFKHPEITVLDLEIDKKVEGLDSLKIVMVADVHVGSMIDRNILRVYVDDIMAQKPDLILLVGDIIDYDLPPLIEQEMDQEFRRLKAPYGVFASTGNHEYRLNAEDKIAWLNEKAELGVLRDSVVNVGDLFYVVGREDDLFPQRKDLSTILKGIDKTKPVILMNHEPKRLSEESDEQIDLALYGHTHNGQLFPYNIVINWVYELGYGYKKKDNTHMFVTSGVGLAGPQYRIGTRSEIVVINLSFK